jgi:hypothetical protein
MVIEDDQLNDQTRHPEDRCTCQHETCDRAANEQLVLSTEPLVLTAAELSERLPGGDLSMELAQRTIALGLMRIEGDTVVIDDPRFLDVGSQLAALGVPLAETR